MDELDKAGEAKFMINCPHHIRSRCQHCGEQFCPICDEYHRAECADRNKP